MLLACAIFCQFPAGRHASPLSGARRQSSSQPGGRGCCRLPLHLGPRPRHTAEERLAVAGPRPSSRLASAPAALLEPATGRQPIRGRSRRELTPPPPRLSLVPALFRRPPPGKSAGGFCSVRRSSQPADRVCELSERSGATSSQPLAILQQSSRSKHIKCSQISYNTIQYINTYIQYIYTDVQHKHVYHIHTHSDVLPHIAYIQYVLHTLLVTSNTPHTHAEHWRITCPTRGFHGSLIKYPTHSWDHLGI